MYRTLLLLTVLVLSIPLAAQAVTTQEVVNQISVASFQAYNQALPTHLGNNRCINYQLVGNVYEHGADHDTARDEIFQWFRRSGWTTFLDPINITDTSGNIWTGANVIAVKQGTVTPDKVYLVMAHYDSTANHEPGGVFTSAPGGDDNGSGVAGILEMARVFGRYTFDSTIIFVASDGEETTAYGNDGITYRRIGSIHYVNKYASTLPNIQAMISADMFAWQSSSGPGYIRLDSGYSQNTALDSQITSALKTYGGFTTVQNVNSQNYSDHVSFANQGVPALMVIEYNWSSNPNYHHMTDACDTPNYINYTYGTNVVKGIAGWLCERAGLNGTLSSSVPSVWPEKFAALASARDVITPILKGTVR